MTCKFNTYNSLLLTLQLKIQKYTILIYLILIHILVYSVSI